MGDAVGVAPSVSVSPSLHCTSHQKCIVLQMAADLLLHSLPRDSHDSHGNVTLSAIRGYLFTGMPSCMPSSWASSLAKTLDYFRPGTRHKMATKHDSNQFEGRYVTARWRLPNQPAVPSALSRKLQVRSIHDPVTFARYGKRNQGNKREPLIIPFSLLYRAQYYAC